MQLRIYQSIFNNAEEAMIIENQNREIIDANPVATETLGYSRQELLGMKTTDLITSQNQEVELDEVYHNPRSQSSLTFMTHSKTKTGNILPFEVTLIPINQEEQSLFLSIMRNVSTEDRTEDVLKSENCTDENCQDIEYQALFEISLQGIILIDGPPNRITLANPAAAEILGYTEDQLTSLSPKELESSIHWTDRDDLLRQLGSLYRGEKESVRTRSRFFHKDGDTIWLDLSMVAVPAPEGLSVLATFIDITEWRETAADIIATNRDLDLYGSLLRHDFRNDLLVISGNSEIIGMLAAHNQEIKQYVEANLAGVDRMLQLLDLFGSPEKSQSRQIAPILENIWSYATRTYVDLECKLHIDPDVFMTTVVSGKLLPMVFNNLIRNTVKYAAPNPKMTIEATRQENHIKIRVADNGPGIPEEIHDDLFERGTTTEGTGLGLYLSERVIDAYGGTIRLGETKTPQEGAVFVIKLQIREE
jgi:PAS domain S-box-containing protein